MPVLFGILALFGTTLAIGRLQRAKIKAALVSPPPSASSSTLSPAAVGNNPVSQAQPVAGVPENVQPISLADLEQLLNQHILPAPPAPSGGSGGGGGGGGTSGSGGGMFASGGRPTLTL
jgi:uncharacterized membrane protein YgcG